jgi:GNAT superfamily N-acetyltransferase
MEYAKDTPNRVRENIATNFPDPNLLTPQGMQTLQGQQARNALADVLMGFAGTTTPVRGLMARITKGLPVGMSIKSIDELAAKYPDVKIDAFVTKDDLNLSRIVVPKEMRNQGLGTQVMNDLSEYADNIGKRITLTPSSDFGGNVKRLKEFYKDFGFVENKGKNKDFSISETMYREPKPQAMIPQGQQARNALADVMMGVAGTTKPIKAAGGLLGDLNQFRQVDMFGNGSRMQYFDDAKNLYYESQKYPSGRVGWKAGEVVDGNTNWLSDKEFSSMAEAAASVRGQRISNSLNERNASLYGDIPKLWDADAKKVAKGLIDAGVPIERFSQSTQSPSKYIYLQDGRKVRVSNHNLPLGYEQPDYNFVSGENVANFVKKITAP